MAAQTKTQREAAAKKAAATRKRNSARQSGGTAKASARRTRSSAQDTGRAARTTAKQAASATAHQAERVVLIPVGAALETRDRVTDTVRTYTDSGLTRQELNRFERRGAKALGRTRRTAERRT